MSTQVSSRCRVLLVASDPETVARIEDLLSSAEDAGRPAPFDVATAPGPEAAGALDEADLLLVVPDGLDAAACAALVDRYAAREQGPVLLLSNAPPEDLAAHESVQDRLPREDLSGPWLHHALHHALRHFRTLRKLRTYALDARASAHRFERMVEQNADGILIIDHEGRIRFANRAAEHLLGRPTEELEGVEWGYPLDTNGAVDLDVVQRDGSHVVLEMRMVALEEPPQTLYLASLRDVTAPRKAEEVLREAKNAAEAANRAKSAFLANMSHDIRTPLTGIIGLASVLTKRASGRNQEYAQRIVQAGQRLTETLNAVLRLARMEANDIRFDLQTLCLAEEASSVVLLFQGVAQEKGLSLHFEADGEAQEAWARLDRSAFSTVLDNLIGNALKFTKEGSVSVEVTTERLDGAPETAQPHLYVHVRDTGIGISSAFVPYLFDAFRQENASRTQHEQGSGLGLAITKHLTELMGGTIRVESEKGQGSCFTIAFPVVDRPSDADEAPRPERRDGTCRLLVVDDDDDSRFMLEELLTPLGRVTTVPGPGEALELARDGTFDLVLLDVRPGADHTGHDVIEQLRALPAYRDVPILALTALVSGEDRRPYLEAGFTELLAKPYDVDDLLRAVHAYLPTLP